MATGLEKQNAIINKNSKLAKRNREEFEKGSATNQAIANGKNTPRPINDPDAPKFSGKFPDAFVKSTSPKYATDKTPSEEKIETKTAKKKRLKREKNS